MDAKQFLAEFRHIASAPGGIQRLRELILQLAVSGDLVQPDPDDGTVEAALAEAERSKIQYEADLGLRTRMLPDLREGDYPYSIPEHWRWVCLEQIACYVQRGKSPTYADSSATFVVSQKCIQWKGFDISVARYVDESSLKSYGKERFLQFGDLLWNSTGTGTVGRVAIYEEKESIKAVADTHVTVIRLGNFLPRYIWCVISAPWVQARIIPEHEDSIVSGTTNQVELATSSVRALPIPCPPISEQKRIVTKVDELMALCDKLEAQQQERETVCELARATALQAFVDAEESPALQGAWSRVRANINILLDGERGVLAFQESLKKLSVRGLLSVWTEDRPPIDEIKDDCAALKQEYIRTKWLRKQKTGAANAGKSKYPPHWAVVPFDDVAVVIGGITKGRDLRGRSVQSCAYLRVANVQRGFFDLAEMKYIEVPVDEIAKYRVESGDLLITEGGDWDKVGRTAIWEGAISECLHQNHVFKARVPSRLLMNEWVELVFNSNVGRDYFAEASKQTTNLASINMTQLRSFPMPIPPVSEQVAILQKVKALLSLCTEIEWQKRESQNIAQMLASSAVASVTGIQIEDKHKMKAPKTELVSTLRIGVSPKNKELAPLTTILVRNQGELPAKELWNSSGLEIDAFYQQLKTEMAKGWIVQPEVAYVQEVEAS